MTTRLIIIRHGNTFLPDDIPTRVGSQTDLPLVEKEKSEYVGQYLKTNGLSPDLIITAPLLRTRQTAEIINNCQEVQVDIIENNDFTEINYGPDENKTEELVKRRIGTAILNKNKLDISAHTDKQIMDLGNNEIKQWDEKAIPPEGWVVDVNQIKNSWINFSSLILDKYNNKTVVVVSSNGIIRFSPVISNKRPNIESLKVKTGSISVFEESGNGWVNKIWGLNPRPKLN
jgi:probable phosphoglycerate mutase